MKVTLLSSRRIYKDIFTTIHTKTYKWNIVHKDKKTYLQGNLNCLSGGMLFSISLKRANSAKSLRHVTNNVIALSQRVLQNKFTGPNLRNTHRLKQQTNKQYENRNVNGESHTWSTHLFLLRKNQKKGHPQIEVVYIRIKN